MKKTYYKIVDLELEDAYCLLCSSSRVITTDLLPPERLEFLSEMGLVEPGVGYNVKKQCLESKPFLYLCDQVDDSVIENLGKNDNYYIELNDVVLVLISEIET